MSTQEMGKEDAVSPVIGVILMVAITVILAAVIGAFVFAGTSVPSCCNTAPCQSVPCSQEETVTANITIASTDDGLPSWPGTPYYIFSTEPFRYETKVSRQYHFATDHICQNVTIAYKKYYRDCIEVREIIGIKPQFQPCCQQTCQCNPCGKCC